MKHPRILQNFQPLVLHGKDGDFSTQGIPGLGVEPARPMLDPELQRMLGDPAFLKGLTPDREQALFGPRMRNLCFATASAFFAPAATTWAVNRGGQVQSLQPVWQAGARQRTFGGVLTLASQASGTVLGLCRLPLFGAIVGITVINSVSLSTATLAIGDANSSNVYMAASTFTNVDTPTRVGKTVAQFSQLTQGYDANTGAATNYSSGQTASPPNPNGDGSLYEDVLVTTGTASLPASGTLVILVDYVID